MKKDYILFIDSGIGGLSTLAACIKKVNANYLYFADTKNTPYGSLKKEEIIKILTSIISQIKTDFNIKIVVIACNTATAAAIDTLRQKYSDLFFIGTEPAVCLAKKMGFSRPLALTTPLTSQQKRYKNLIALSQTATDTLTEPNLAKDIENYHLNPGFEHKLNLIMSACKVLATAKNNDCIILGCTHYVFFEPFLKKFSNLPLINGNAGISSNLEKNTLKYYSKNKQESTVRFIFSKGQKLLLKKYQKILSQTLANFQGLC